MAVNERNAGGANGGAERDPGIERLYREAAGETPPAHLDAAILAAARREVGARPRALVPALRRWHIPVSIAAVVVVTVSLVILVREEGVTHVRNAEVRESATLRMEGPAVPPTPESPGEARTGRVDKEPQAAAPAPEPRRQALRDDARASRAVPSPVTEERGAQALSDAVPGGRTAAAPAAPSQPFAAPPAAEMPQAKPMARAQLGKSAESDRSPAWREFEKEPPEKWLARIEELRKEGRAAEAEHMLSEFKRRFPEHPVASGSR